MWSHYIIASVWHIVNLLASSPGAKWHCAFPPFGLIFMFPLCTQADKRSIRSFFSLLHLDLDLTALEKATCMCRAAIVCNQVPFSFDIKGGKGHVMQPFLRPSIFILFSSLRIFLHWLFSQVRLTASSLFLILSVVPIPLSSPYTHAHSCTRAHTQRKIYMCQTFSKGKTKALS